MEQRIHFNYNNMRSYFMNIQNQIPYVLPEKLNNQIGVIQALSEGYSDDEWLSKIYLSVVDIIYNILNNNLEIAYYLVQDYNCYGYTAYEFNHKQEYKNIIDEPEYNIISGTRLGIYFQLRNPGYYCACYFNIQTDDYIIFENDLGYEKIYIHKDITTIYIDKLRKHTFPPPELISYWNNKYIDKCGGYIITDNNQSDDYVANTKILVNNLLKVYNINSKVY